MQYDQLELANLYQNNYGLIFQITQKFTSTHGGDIEEYLSYANEVFIEACKTYEETRAKFSTWLFFFFRRKFNNYKQKLEKQVPVSECPIDNYDSAYSNFSRLEYLDNFTKKQQIIIDLIWNFPKNKNRKGHNQTKLSDIRRELLKLNWTIYEIDSEFEKIKNIIKEN